MNTRSAVPDIGNLYAELFKEMVENLNPFTSLSGSLRIKIAIAQAKERLNDALDLEELREMAEKEETLCR